MDADGVPVIPVRLGFVGLGRAATRAHLPALAPLVAAGEVELRAFCDVDPEIARTQAAAFGARAVYADAREMLAKDRLDAVYVCIPPTLHGAEILLAAERGVAVFAEKPQTLDMARALRFADAIRRAGVVSQVGFQSRYYPSAEHARRLLARRTPRHAQVQLFYSGVPVHTWTSRYALCGGSFVEHAIHMVDLLRWFLGDVAAVSAFYVQRRPREGPASMDLPHVYNVSYRFVSGVTANVAVARVLDTVDVERRELVVVSDDSLLEWRPEKVAENGTTVWEGPPEAAEEAYAFGLQARAFIDAVRARDPGLVRSPYDAALNSLAAVLAANASAERGGELVEIERFVTSA